MIERDFSDCLVLFDLETSARIMECMYSTVYEIDAGLALWSLFSFQQLGMAVYNAFLVSR